MNEETRQLIRKWFQENLLRFGHVEESQRGLNAVQKVVHGTCNDADELEQILIGPIGPSVVHGCGWPCEYREKWENYGPVIKGFWDANKDKESLSRENYIKFRSAFFDHCKGGRPKIIVNRLVAMLFPKQFIQVVSEGIIHVAYKRLAHMGAFSEYLRRNSAEDLDNRWFDENSAIMNMLRDALGDLGNDYEFADFGWCLVSHFRESSKKKPPKMKVDNAMISDGAPKDQNSAISQELSDVCVLNDTFRDQFEEQRSMPLLRTDIPPMPFTMREFISANYTDRHANWVAHALRRAQPHETWLEAPMTFRLGSCFNLKPRGGVCVTMTFGNRLTLITGGGKCMINGKTYMWPNDESEGAQRLFAILRSPMSNFQPIITNGNA